MIQPEGTEHKTIRHKTFLGKVSEADRYKKLEGFFDMEEELLGHIYRLEKEEAQKTASRLLTLLLKRPIKEKTQSVQSYLITLSAMVTRHLEKEHISTSKAFAFQDTCENLIMTRLTEENATSLAKELIELFFYVLTERNPPVLKHETVNNALSYIDNEIESSLTVEGIAKQFDVSTSHLSRIFHEHTTITLVEYINVRKVEEAQYYLRFSDKKISDISNLFHFCNQSYFTRIFKKYTGETPRRFRFNMDSEYFRFELPESEILASDSESL